MEDYREFVRSYVNIYDPRLREFAEKKISEKEFWPPPLIQLSPTYKEAETLGELAEKGLIHPETARIFGLRLKDHRLWQHQVEGITLAQKGQDFVVTSGTGSGKTLCFLVPIVDAVVRNAGIRGPIAFLVYPTNALVNSQLAALQDLAQAYREKFGRIFPVTFARYTGETEEPQREEIRAHPPHILLTNYVMVELMMVRPEDRPLLEPKAPPEVPFFLVFDELHTYRGRQGADVAMLVRRLRANRPRSDRTYRDKRHHGRPLRRYPRGAPQNRSRLRLPLFWPTYPSRKRGGGNAKRNKPRRSTQPGRAARFPHPAHPR
jgi:ATP-dependent helicase YprA (DUF1998 family)